MITKYPYMEIADGIYEINEFDGVSMFLIIGSERALLVDTGVGIGDLKTFVETLTTLPYDVVITHNHRDHAGNAALFDTVYMSEEDKRIAPVVRDWTSAESRFQFAQRTVRNHPEVQYPWTKEDIRQFTCEEEPCVIEAEDGKEFELGGRTARVILCPGHTPGSLTILDSKTHVLLAGDCCNHTTGIGVRPLENPEMHHVSVERALKGLERLSCQDIDKEKIFCAHTDFRGFGKPLGAQVLPNLIQAMRRVVQGNYIGESEYIPVLNLTVDSAKFDDLDILLQFHKNNILENAASTVTKERD